jgi:hypothetical protein
MLKLKLALAAVVLSAGMFTSGDLAIAESRNQFCNRWHEVCRQCTGRGATVPRMASFCSDFDQNQE